eukprot:TRINITY_DN8063_c0_g1_i2.p1 TRINITY_DN8063_c0_g1~~TRINITY_DN8063_c0_g1_i2.p1  ORF type:complete len:205 (+),score=13.23 TRINITY_DN8063_c0_g1_i2:125-739(+)
MEAMRGLTLAIASLLCVEASLPADVLFPPPPFAPPDTCQISLIDGSSLIQPLGGAYVHSCIIENQRVQTGVSTAVLAPVETFEESSAGVVTVIDITTAHGVLGLTYTVGSLTPSSSGYIRIQNVTSCAAGIDSLAGPSLWRYHQEEDPWTDSTWKSDASGGASGFTAIVASESALSVVGRAVVVYEKQPPPSARCPSLADYLRE